MKSIYLLLSPNCNLKCKYCFQAANEPELEGSADYHHQPRLNASRLVIDRFVQFCMDNQVTRVEVFGGEPLFYRKLFQFAAERLLDSVPGLTMGVITNGTLINEEIMRLFDSRPVWLLLSLDGDRERHDALRGCFEKIARWIPRLVRQGRTTVAMQAGVIRGLCQNINAIWKLGLEKVYINIIENYGWYSDDDVISFEREYENIVLSMLEGIGEASCALQLHALLKQPAHKQGCGITGQGLACDWHGSLYPCHRAMEMGAQFAIGDIFSGLNPELNRSKRMEIDHKTFHSSSSTEFPLVSFCPVAVYQKHGEFEGEWNRQFCEMINIKAKIVSKYYYQIEDFVVRRSSARAAGIGSGNWNWRYLESGAQAVALHR